MSRYCYMEYTDRVTGKSFILPCSRSRSYPFSSTKQDSKRYMEYENERTGQRTIGKIGKRMQRLLAEVQGIDAE